MNQDTKTILKYAGVGFLIGFVGFWGIYYLIKHIGGNALYLLTLPGIYLSLFIRFQSMRDYFLTTSIGLGIIGFIVGALIGLVKSYLSGINILKGGRKNKED